MYVLLNIALSRVATGGSARYGLPGLLDLGATSGGGQAYHVVVTLAFFLIPLLLGPAFVARLASWPVNVIQRSSPVAFQLVVLFAADRVRRVHRRGADVRRPGGRHPVLRPGARGRGGRATIHTFAYASFIPLYFAWSGCASTSCTTFGPCSSSCSWAWPASSRRRAATSGPGWRASDPPTPATSPSPSTRGGPGIVLAVDHLRRRHHRRHLLHEPHPAGDRDVAGRRVRAPALAPARIPHRGVARGDQPVEHGALTPRGGRFRRCPSRRSRVRGGS